jgi:L-ornithine N5-oxygenase
LETSHPDRLPIHEVVGIGFGPSNLALAIALEELDRVPCSVFLERQARFGWHRGMLIDNSTMQVSFLKDLVTMRNPSSDFNYLSYLRYRGRLTDFINHKTLYPLRVEFHDYLEWAADRLRHLVRYSAEVIGIEPVDGPHGVGLFDVISREGAGHRQEIVVRRTRNVVVATGLRPRLPDGVVPTERVWHNLELVPKVATLAGTPIRRVAVVGAGQSAAECVDYLHRNFPRAEVCAVFARYGYSPADDSPFVNKIFDPAAVDHFFDAPAEIKAMMMDYHRGANYSVVDLDLITDLYARAYQEKVQGKERLRFLSVSRINKSVEHAGGVDLSVEHLPTGQRQTLSCDLVVYATGYQHSELGGLLGNAAELCERDADNRPVIERDYRIRTRPGVTAGLYLQGGTEPTHGITSTLLSNIAVRAGEIRTSLLAGQRAVRADHNGVVTSGVAR